MSKSERVSDYAVSTDSLSRFADLSASKVPVLWRGPSLSMDDTPSLAVIMEHVNELEGLAILEIDAVALIPCTTPLRTAEDIDGAIQMLEDNPMADSVIGVTECVPIERVKKIVDGLIVDTFPEPQDGQRQGLEKCYTRSGIYVVRRNALDKLFGHKMSLAYPIPPERGINIDTMLDFKIAEMLLKERGGLQ